MADKKTFHNIIDGKIQQSASGAMMDVVNPSTGEVYATAPNSDENDVDLAFRAAGKAFETWRWSTPGERQQALLKLADVIESNAEELVAVECENTGKPASLAMSEEIPPMVDQIRFFAGAARVLEGRSASPPPSDASRSDRSRRSRRGTTR
jgi:betaine-aldehyde dehydrogenase